MPKLIFLVLLFVVGVWILLDIQHETYVPLWILFVFLWAKHFRFNMPLFNNTVLETVSTPSPGSSTTHFEPPGKLITSTRALKPHIQSLLKDHSSTMNIIQSYYDQTGSVEHQLIFALRKKLIGELEPYVSPLLLETAVFTDLLKAEVRRYVRTPL